MFPSTLYYQVDGVPRTEEQIVAWVVDGMRQAD